VGVAVRVPRLPLRGVHRERRMSHTYVILQVSPAAYDEIKAKLEETGYGHAFHEDTEGPLIDMHGIALQVEEPTGR
jgi:hypothetical protein